MREGFSHDETPLNLVGEYLTSIFLIRIINKKHSKNLTTFVNLSFDVAKHVKGSTETRFHCIS